MEKKFARKSALAAALFLAVLLCFLTPYVTYANSPTVSILSPSDGKKIYTTGDYDYPVKIVFKTWDQSDGIRTSGAGAFTLYWQQGVLGSSEDMSDSPRLHSWGPNDTATDVYRSFDWIPPLGSGTYTLQVQSTDNAGAPSTGKSRKIEVEIVVTALNSFNGFPGDGKLLIRDNDNTICMSCHTIKAHSSASIGSTKYGNWERVCRDCHTPHNTRNIFLLHSSFKIYTGVNQSFAYRKKVDFRNVSGASTYGFVSKSGVNRRGPCEVCHTRTRNTDTTPRWRNYTSVPDADGKKHNAGLECTGCHLHTNGFSSESAGNTNCSGCHADIFDPMNTADDGYHHMLSNADVDNVASSGTKYPLLTDIVGADPSSENRRCLMCHVDHDIFKKAINQKSKGRAHNLRRNISTLPNLSSGVNTDFLNSDIDGGICLSCHKRSQIKSYVQPDNTTQTQIINKTLFSGSPHNYTVPASFNSSNYTFDANCSKCHIDTISKTKQAQGNQFGPHYSVVRKINAVSQVSETKANWGAISDGSISDSYTLNDPGMTWGNNIWKERTVRILSGVAAGQSRYITGNTNESLTISPAWTTIPSVGDTYIIGISRDVENGLVASSGPSTLTVLNANWIPDFWLDRPVTIVKGTAYGQTRQIVSNTGDTLTLSAPWDTQPVANDKYSIGDPSEEELCFRCHSEQSNPYAASKRDFFDERTFENAKVLKMEELFYARGEFHKASASASDSTLTASPDPGWSTDQWAGQKVIIVAGRGVGQEVTVLSNSNNTLTISPAWSSLNEGNGVIPSSANFYVGAGNPFRHRMEKYFAKHRSDEAEVAPEGLTSQGWFNNISVTNGLHSGCQDCHNPHGNRKGGDDNGTAESGSSSHLRDSDKTWTQDEWRGYTLRLMDGNGRGQDRVIAFNTATSLHVSASFQTSPNAGTYYIISPNGTPDKGNNLWNPNSGIWGVDVNYPVGRPPLNTMRGPDFTKKKILTGGSDKVYQLCFKCHSEYAWGTSGTPFTIPDSLGSTINTFIEGPTTNIAEEFNPNNLGYHPIVDIGANQPIIAMGDMPVDVVAGELAAHSAGSPSTISFNNQWTPNKYNGYCVEVTGGNVSGEIRSIMGSDTTSITVDPAFSAAPDESTLFHIRKCSIYNVGAKYAAGGLSTPWPRFTGGTADLTAGNSTVTIKGLANGIPPTVLRGWYIYVGELRTGANNLDTPKGGVCSSTAPCPPMLSTKGWFQVVDIEAGASDAETTSVDLVISPPPEATLSDATYALTAGLGNTFVPPYGPWSLISCPDCHDTDDSKYPSGPHASSRQWILRTLEAQSFPWYYGGINSFTSTTTVSTIKTISFPDGKNTGWGDDFMYMPNYTCMNCHRPDVYGSAGKSPATGTVPSGSAFQNYSWQYLSRVPHLPAPSAWGTDAKVNPYGINCMSCHGGDNRVDKGITNNNPEKALGGIHGSNLGVGTSPVGYGDPTRSLRGRRLLNGAVWNGVTRASTSTGTQCSYGYKDAVGSCSVGTNWAPNTGRKANYPYFSGGDAAGTDVFSATATNVAPGKMGLNAGDQVIVTFSAETNGDTVTIDNNTVDTILDLGPGKSWLSGAGALGGTGFGVWSSVTYLNDTLVITLDDTGGQPSVAPGDTITLEGAILGGDGGQIIATVDITGNFDIGITSAVASDINNGGIGIQEKADQVVLLFDDQTEGTIIDGTNIDTALVLSNGHRWTEGSLGIYSSAWSNTHYINDTLTITLNNMTSSSRISILDTITLDGATIKDIDGTPITGSLQLFGSFDSVPDGVVAFWKLEETNGANMNVYDETVYANHGVRTGTYGVSSGKRGRAYIFDGLGGDRIEVADDKGFFNLTSQATIEFWMKRDPAPASDQVYVEKSGVFTIKDFSGTGRISFIWNGTILTTAEALNNDVWYHIVATYDGTNQYIYVNGSLAAGPQAASRAAANGNTVFIGSNSSLSYTVTGLMDDILIYNKALTESEAKARYGSWLVSAKAKDSSGLGTGTQEGDEVVIIFDGETDALEIDKDNINSALSLGSHTWTEGVQGIYSSAWENTIYPKDTLVITLANMTSSFRVAPGDTISLDGSIKDALGRSITGSVVIGGNFDINPGIVGYWKFDEASGTTIKDATFYNNTGFLIGGTRTNDSYSGYAIDFSSFTDGIRITDYNDILDLTSAGSLEIWAKKTSNKDRQMMVSKGSTTAYQFSELGMTGKVTSRWGQGAIDNYSTASALLTNGWNHIVVTYDGSDLLYYVNGEAAGGGAYSTDAVPDNDPLWIGNMNGTQSYDGILDEAVIYNTALSLSEVQNRYVVRLDSADAVAFDNATGIQAGDGVVIRFKSPTAGTAVSSVCADTSSIDAVLTLNGGSSWGPMSPGQCSWSNNPHANDTLTIQLAAGAHVGIGDTITLDGSTLLDNLGRGISGSIQIGGTFGTTINEPVNAVGHWKLDTLSAADETANNNDGTVIGSPNLVTGRFGNALETYFAMTVQYVSVADSNSLDLTTEGSLEMWVKGGIGSTKLLQKGTAYSLEGDSNRVKFSWGASSITSPAAISTNEWHHIVGTYDGAALSLYIDGILVNSAASLINTSANTSPLTIATASNPFYGNIDEVVIYNRAIDITEVKERFGARPVRAVAIDASFGGEGVQTGDEVVITFNGSTKGDPLSNISTALVLDSGSWGTPGSIVWSDADGFTNNVLTITLAEGTGASIDPGATITLGTQIKDVLSRTVTGNITITGSFDIPPGVVAYWKFDEGSGTSLADSSLNNNIGTIQNNYTWTNESHNNYALDFDGLATDGTIVRVNHHSSLALSTQGSLEVWTKWKPDGQTSLQGLISKGFNTYVMGVVGSTGIVDLRWGENVASLSSVSALEPDKWNHIIATYNGSELKLYINGKLDNSVAHTLAANTSNSYTLYLGNNQNIEYKGIMDEVVIYNDELLAQEVEKRYRVKMESAMAIAVNDTPGPQAGDQVVIKFRSPTEGNNEFCTDTARIDAALALSGVGSTWGTMGTGQCAWTTTDHSNDTLSITLGTGAVIGVGDTITLGGGDSGYTVRDNLLPGRTISDSIPLGGTFGNLSSVPVNAVGYWKLDGDTNDSTINNNHATGTSAGYLASNFGQALDFESSSFHNISASDSNSLNLTTAGSVEAWIKKESSTALQTIMSKGAAYRLFEESTGQVSFQWAGAKVTSNAIPGIGEWHHIVGTYDGSSLAIYVDGNPDNSTNHIVNATANSDSLTIGSQNGSNYFDGLIDEVVIYNSAITATEILKRYGSWPVSAVASDPAPESPGIQDGDKIVITFANGTNADAINLSTDLVMNGSGSWGSSTYGWSSDGGNTNDTLAITLTGASNISVGDVITLQNSVVRDSFLRPITGSVQISGTFGTGANQPANAVGYWNFDETSGITAYDLTANNNDGTAQDSTSWIDPGKYDRALDFDGSSDYVEMTDNNSLDLTNQGSIELWVYKDGYTNNQVWINKGEAFGLRDNGTTGQIVFWWGSTANRLTSSTLSINEWHHVVATYDGANMTLYIDKNPDNTVTMASSLDATANSTQLRIGASSTATDNFDGRIDDVVLYNKALSFSEVEDRYGASLTAAVGADTTIAGAGLQGGDQVILRFNGMTNATTITNMNADTVLNISGKTWLDGSGALGMPSPAWTGAVFAGDTLTITLGDTTSLPDIAIGDAIVLDGSIRDSYNRKLRDSVTISGTFDVPAGAIAYWRYDDSGLIVSDATANHLDGTAYSDITPAATWTSGRIGSGLLLDGTDDYVNYADNAAFALASSYAIEAWIKPDSFAEEGSIFYNADGSYFRYSFSLHSDGRIGFSHSNDGSLGGIILEKSTGTLTLNKWNHVVVTRSGKKAGSLPDTTFYINGVASGVFEDNHYDLSSGTNTWTGRSDLGGGSFFDGVIDEVIVFNRHLSAEEVKIRRRTWMESARVSDASAGGYGIQANDQIVITFNGETNAPVIGGGDIETVLAINNGHLWLPDGGGLGGSGTGVWSSDGGQPNDTLTITFNNTTGSLAVAPGDVITLNSTILDSLKRIPLNDTMVISGTFDAIPPGASGYWKFDEAIGSGTIVIDGTVNDNHGTINGAGRTSPGYDNEKYALSFDGINDYVEMTATNLNLTDYLKIAFRINGSSTNQQNADTIIEGDAFKVEVWQSGPSFSILPSVKTGNGWQAGTVATTDVFTDSWHQVEVTWIGGSTNSISVSIDGGPPEGTTATSGSTITLQENMRLGSNLGGTAYFQGLIDELIIFSQ